MQEVRRRRRRRRRRNTHTHTQSPQKIWLPRSRPDTRSNSLSSLSSPLSPQHSKIILDCTGNGSPIAREYRKEKPSGICVVVGTCASGYDSETNDFGDVIYTNGGINEKNLQYFWESFPVGKVKEGEVREWGEPKIRTQQIL